MTSGPWWRSRRAMLVGGAIIAIAVLVGVIVMVTSGDKGNDPVVSDESLAPSSSKVTSTTRADAGNAASSTTSTRRVGSATTGVGAATTPANGSGPAGVQVPPTQAPQITQPSGTPAEDPLQDQLTNAYTSAFEGQCRSIWSHAAADGNLWDADDDPVGDPHTLSECLDALDPQGARFYDTVAEAHAAGIDDAISTAEDMTVGNRFRNANNVIYVIP